MLKCAENALPFALDELEAGRGLAAEIDGQLAERQVTATAPTFRDAPRRGKRKVGLFVISPLKSFLAIFPESGLVRH